MALLAALVLAALSRGTRPNRRLHCVSNLKLIGLASRMWANDHSGRFPWQVPMAARGTLELAETSEVFRHFLALSNELSSPNPLACLSDTKRTRATDFAWLGNQHLSYFNPGGVGVKILKLRPSPAAVPE